MYCTFKMEVQCLMKVEKKTANNFHCVVFTFSVLHQTRKESMTVKPLSQT